MKRLMRCFALLASVSLVLALFGGCAAEENTRSEGGDAGNASGEQTAAPSQPRRTTSARVYFVRGESIGVAGRAIELAAGETTTSPTYLMRVVASLLKGPTVEEREFGLGTVIPEDTRVLGVQTNGSVATVDLSRVYESGGGSLSMLLRVAQVVCTLTQFEEIDSVAFKLDGKPAEAIGGEGVIVSPSVGREDFEGQLPAILVEGPIPGEEIASPVRVWGSSNVFEAQHVVEVTDPEGLIVAEKAVMATSGTGTRGTWSVEVPFETKREGLGAVIAFEESAKDGSRINVVEIPIRMSP